MAPELQSLDLTVYDINTLEKGIIAQVDEAVRPTSNTIQLLEEGELSEDDFEKEIRIGDVTPLGTILEETTHITHYPKRSKCREDSLTDLERYLQSQAALQATKKKIKISPNKSTLSDKEDKLIIKKSLKEIKQKPVKSKKKRVKFENGENSFESKEQQTLLYDERKKNNSSDSEYVPSECSSSEDELVKKKSSEKNKKIIKRKKLVRENSKRDSDVEYSEEEQVVNKRKKINELDDGDIDLFTKRIKQLNWDANEKRVHIVSGALKCPLKIWEKLFLYQQVALKWFWSLNQERCGGILGDEMGLGKTIQVIAFLACLDVSKIEDYDTGFSGLGPSIIVCPTTVMYQWIREFHKWYPPLRVVILHESGTYNGKDRTKLINNIHTYTKGVVITSYSALVQHQEKFLHKKWHYVILDEGHKIRNPTAQVTAVAKKFETPHRIILSGSPMQNNLKELWSLLDFIYPGLLGTLQAFTTRFQTPIVQGGYANASQLQVTLAYKLATVLKDTITPYLLRRMKCDVDNHIHLPSKTEQVLFCRLTEEQRHYYKTCVDNLDLQEICRKKEKMFLALNSMRKICNHPDLYSGGPNKDFTITIDDNSIDNGSTFGYWKRAGKMIVIETLLKIWKEQGHKVLLFTQGIKMLVIMEEFIKKKRYKYLRLDGNTTISSRQPTIDKFNKDPAYFVMLLTTKVGGLGINLTGANRIVIYDPDWNPATDTQARERAWRIGQDRAVTIYRLITAGSIEEKIYHRQIFKQYLCNKVLKDPRQRRFFKSNDLMELFSLNETVENGTNETAAIFAGINSEIKMSSKDFDEKNNENSKEEIQDTKVIFSESKLEEMRKLAQKLSKKLINNVSSKKENNNELKNNHENFIYDSDGKIMASKAQELLQTTKNEISKTDGQSENINEIKSNKENQNSMVNTFNKKKSTGKILKHFKTSSKNKISHRKHKKEKYEIFEGNRIPNLLKYKKIKRNKDKIAKRMSQDEYVLRNLFSKTGLETVLRHDTIMEAGPSDYAIVEAEAEKVAQESVKLLKESRIRVPQVRKSSFFTSDSNKEQKEANCFLDVVRKRNVLLNPLPDDNQLAQQMVSWLCSQGSTASTDEIVKEFQKKVGSGKSPLFKSLLSKIAQFYRGPDGIGYWSIREEFK